MGKKPTAAKLQGELAAMKIQLEDVTKREAILRGLKEEAETEHAAEIERAAGYATGLEQELIKSKEAYAQLTSLLSEKSSELEKVTSLYNDAKDEILEYRTSILNHKRLGFFKRAFTPIKLTTNNK